MTPGLATPGLEAPVLIALVGFVSSVAVIIGLGLFVISLVMRLRRSHRRRLARVGRGRVTGRVDVEELRGDLLLRPSEDGAIAGRLMDSLARLIPLLDTARVRHDLERAGLRRSLGGVLIATLLVACAIAIGARLAIGIPLPVGLAVGLLAGMMLVNAVLRFLGERRSQRFLLQLPDALDSMVRGIRAGLPVVECIASAGRNMPDPIGAHFRTVVDRVRLGETLDEALWLVSDTIRRPEMDFLAVSVSIQSETGGSLTDALNNLSDMLRKREAMKLKISAISSEAKASGMIIGALPVVMLVLLSIMSPDYIVPLFADTRGNVMLGVGAGSMLLGGLVMWRMTKFEI